MLNQRRPGMPTAAQRLPDANLESSQLKPRSHRQESREVQLKAIHSLVDRQPNEGKEALFHSQLDCQPRADIECRVSAIVDIGVVSAFSAS